MNNNKYEITFIPELDSREIKRYKGTLTELINESDLTRKLHGVKPRTIKGFVNRLNESMKPHINTYCGGYYFYKEV